MKAIQRWVIKVAHGKMAEYMELMVKEKPIVSRCGMPPFKVYRLLSGEGDVVHTLIYEIEWDSLAAMEAFYANIMADPEYHAFIPQWDSLIESRISEVYTPMPS